MGLFTTAALAAMTLAQGASQYIGQRKAGKAADREGRFAQSQLEKNAKFAEGEAADAVERGALSAKQRHAETGRSVGTGRAAYASQGVTMAGTPGAVLEEISAVGALDERMIRENAAREAWGLTAQAADYRAQGKLARMAGRNQQKAANTAAFGTLLTTAASVGSQVRDYKVRR